MLRPSIFLIYLLLIFVLPSALWAGTVKFQHLENQNIELSDAAFPEVVKFQASRQFKNSTVFALPASSFHFLMLSVDTEKYYLWITTEEVEINLLNIQVGAFDGYNLLSKENWHKSIDSKSSLKTIAEIDAYYVKALDALYAKAENDSKFRNSMLFDEVVWNKHSAKRLYNYAFEHFSNQFDPNYVLYSKAYFTYWELIYKLYYQYFHTNSFKGLLPLEAYNRLSGDFPEQGLDALFLIHFFRDGTPKEELKENYNKFEEIMSSRQIAYAKSRLFSEPISISNLKTEFIFGVDIDAALQGFYAKDSSNKHNLLIFWSAWDKHSERELLLLRDYHQKFWASFNFIFICTDGGMQNEKVKAMIYRDNINGFHLIPESNNAFQNSLYKQSLKIRGLPFYVVTDQAGGILASEEMSLDVSKRLIKKLEHYAP